MSRRIACAAVLMLLTAAPVPARQAPPAQPVSLAADTVMNGVPCRRTGGNGRKAELHPSGALRSCELAAGATVAGHLLPAGSWIYLYEDGQPDFVWLRSNTLLQGHLCRGTGYGGWQTMFHGSGALRSCWLARDSVIDGVPCSRATFLGEIRGGASTLFEPDGRLRSCRAARDFRLGDEFFRKGERVSAAGFRS
jgi:hypothetical protein